MRRKNHGYRAQPCTDGIVVSATDHMRAYSEQIRAYLPDSRPFVALGTDGYGRQDTR